MNTLPWQDALWRELTARRIPQALLLQGGAGIGKLCFAQRLARALLCEKPTETADACGRCSACRWILGGTHPDFYELMPIDPPEKEQQSAKQTIMIEQVRAIRDELALSTHQGKLRIVLIHPAEAMTHSAANALLKILEEPPQDTLFLLVSHRPQRLLATVASRCTRLMMSDPLRQIATEWLANQGVVAAPVALAHAGYAPLRALEKQTEGPRQAFMNQLIEGERINPFALAEAHQKAQAEVVGWLQQWVYDLILYKFVKTVRYNIELQPHIERACERVGQSALITYFRELMNAQGLINHPLRAELFLEKLLIGYCRLFRRESCLT